MIKQLQREVHFCDSCGMEIDCPYCCMGCGMELCYDCYKKKMVEYKHAVHFSGTGDGVFCKVCDAIPPAEVEALWNAYQKIQALKSETEKFYQDFDKRSKKAEKELAELYAQVVGEK